MTSLIEEKIADVIWRSCDALRGSMDSAFFMEYVLTILFLRRISNTPAAEKQVRTTKSASVSRAFRPDLLHQFIVPERADFWSVYNACRECKAYGELGVAKRLDDALSSIAHANPMLQGVFQGIKFDTPRLGSESQRENLVCKLLSIFATEELDLLARDDQRGAASIYDDLIEKFADGLGKRTGSFSTPASLSSLLVRLLDPQPGMHICDPACGSGSMLLRAAEYIQKNYSSSNYSLSGQEQNGTVWALAQLNMLLHGESTFRIALEDTLQHPKLLDERERLIQYDIGIAHIPFGATTWADERAVHDTYQRFVRGVPPKKKPEYAFILHLLATMKPDSGRVGVIVPLGALFRGGVETVIRESLIRDRLLDAVIELPEGLLFGTAVPAAIMLFRGGKRDNSVVFIDASKTYQAGKLKNQLQEEDILRIIEAYKTREEVRAFCHIASFAEIAENDYNLNVRRYVINEVVTKFRDPSAIRSDRMLLEDQLKTLEVGMRDYLDELRNRSHNG